MTPMAVEHDERSSCAVPPIRRNELSPPVVQRCRAQTRPGCPRHGDEVQKKVAVGPSGDRFEQEADRIASRIVGSASASVGPVSPISPGRGASTEVANVRDRSGVTWPTGEEMAMLGHQPGGTSAIHAYYVPRLSRGSLGETFGPEWNPATPDAVVVADGANSETFAHEIGHVLLAKRLAVHHGDADNLMASGRVRNVVIDELECAQCENPR